MPIPVHIGTRTVFCGDSITFQGWFSDTESLVGGTNLLVQQLSQPVTQPRPGLASDAASCVGTVGSVTPVTGGGQINAIKSGHPQKQIGDALANIDNWLLSLSPEVAIIHFGRNDVGPPLSPFIPTPLVDFRASYDAVLDQLLVSFPNCKIICLSILFKDECWDYVNGVPTWNNEFDPLISEPGYTPSLLEYNVQIKASCEAHGGVYADVRAPALLVEVLQNAPPPGNSTGPLSADGTHPNAAGQKLMSDVVFPLLTFT